MTREEAIKHLEMLFDQKVTVLSGEAMCLAIDALQAQKTPTEPDKNQWKGCDTCNRWGVYGYRNYAPAYCRDCGAPLNEAARKELEERLGDVKQKTFLRYKGYTAETKYSVEDRLFYGEILGGIGLAGFQAESVADLEKEFYKAIDDYLASCKEIGRTPQTIWG